MDPHRRDAVRPPQFMRLLARLLIRGQDASYIHDDLDTSYVSDVERGKGGASATWRYTCNVTASVWRVWANQFRGLLTQGIGLDFRLGLRMLAKQRLISAVAGLTLAVGIPASLTLVHGLEVLYGDLPIERRRPGRRHPLLRQGPTTTSALYTAQLRRMGRPDVTWFRRGGSLVFGQRQLGGGRRSARSGGGAHGFLLRRPPRPARSAGAFLGRLMNSNGATQRGGDWRRAFGPSVLHATPDIVGATVRLGAVASHRHRRSCRQPSSFR